METENLMQQLIREEFSPSTIIAIAHRVNTILDFDRVLVLQNGSIIESGPPRDLIEKGKDHSAFAKLVKDREPVADEE
jgi:ATP-binding cassette subfamily C (CFTR/MRP) protein 1